MYVNIRMLAILNYVVIWLQVDHKVVPSVQFVPTLYWATQLTAMCAMVANMAIKLCQSNCFGCGKRKDNVGLDDGIF